MNRAPLSAPYTAGPKVLASDIGSPNRIGRAVLEIIIADILQSEGAPADQFLELTINWIIHRADEMEVNEWLFAANGLIGYLQTYCPHVLCEADEQIITAVSGRTVGVDPPPDLCRSSGTSEMEQLVWRALYRGDPAS